MKRFSHGDEPRNVTWPDPEKGEGAHLFAPRPRFRRLVALIDDELSSGGILSAPLTREGLLSDLLGSRLIRVYRYRDDGPPATTIARPDQPSVYEGWAVVTHADPEHERWAVSYDLGPDRWVQSGIMGNAVAIAAADDGTGAYSQLDLTAAAARRRADGLAAQVASQALAADIYITERPYLHATKWDLARGVTLCRTEEALPLVGLYLRAQGDFRVASKMTCNRGLFYWVGTRELLPAGWRWFAACNQHGAPTHDSDLSRLSGSLFQRFERALEARDGVQIALNQPQHNDTRREILARLDDVLVDLMGAVDAAARVAHRVLGLPPEKEFFAGWQNEKWLKTVKGPATPLAQTVAPGSDGAQTLTILRKLRNSVHGTALQSIALQEQMRKEQSLIRIPPDDEADVLAAMDGLGGKDVWGARRILNDSVHIDAGVFVDTLFPKVIELLNDLMAHTPVELLANVALSDADKKPPAPDPRNTGIWDEWVRTSIRWQLGF